MLRRLLSPALYDERRAVVAHCEMVLANNNNNNNLFIRRAHTLFIDRVDKIVTFDRHKSLATDNISRLKYEQENETSTELLIYLGVFFFSVFVAGRQCKLPIDLSDLITFFTDLVDSSVGGIGIGNTRRSNQRNAMRQAIQSTVLSVCRKQLSDVSSIYRRKSKSSSDINRMRG